MSLETYVFDPNGDVTLILSRRSQTSAAPSGSLTTPANGLSNVELGHTPVRMLVSSRHLILASSTFASMLKSSWWEGSTFHSEGKVEIPLPDDDPEPVAILLNIIHGRTKKVPRRLELDQLVKIAIVVDKYEMQEAIAFSANSWLDSLEESVPKDLTKDIIQWICVSWVFGNCTVFQKVTEILIRKGDTDLDEDALNELPIPEKVINKINYERREGAIKNLIVEVHRLLMNYGTSEIACKRSDSKLACDACDAMVIGSIFKWMQNAQLWPVPDPPYGDLTFESLTKDLLAIRINTLCDFSDSGNGRQVHKGTVGSQHKQRGAYNRYRSLSGYDSDDDIYSASASEKIMTAIKQTVNSLSDKLSGLKIEEFQQT